MAQLMDMPKLSDTMKEGVLRKWQKKEGDKISAGELVAEVETDKATMDFESFDEGTILKLLVPDGATVPVGAPIAILGKPGEDISAMLAEAEKRTKSAAGGAPAKPAVQAPAPTPVAAPKAEPAAAPAPKPAVAPAPKPAPAQRPPLVPAPRPAPQPQAAANGAATKVLASPLARKLATDLGVDLRSVQGTGPGGRIVERDVKAVAENPAAARADSAALLEQVPSGEGTLPHPLAPERRAEARPAVSGPQQDQILPLSLMRKTIARRLVESKSQVPHFYLTVEVDMDSAMSFREQVKQVHGAKLSVNDMIIKAAALALRRVPEANASYTDEGLVRHGRVDISMAVAIEDGLVTPVIRNADLKTLGQISTDSHELAARARDRKLRPEEMTGGTFSVSNLGMMGIVEFSAIINPPEGAILAVGAVRREPMVKNDQIVIGQRMAMTLSCDHRVIDGALGAKLLGQIVAILERPITLAF
jgi:pyruvate dehydrogenase E2 component (dihydrolipoamide acetyltransferase)